MPFYTGRTGKLKLGTNEVAKVKDWSIDVSVDMLETTSLGDTNKTFTTGVTSTTGSATVSYYTGSSNGVVQLLEKITKTGAVTEADQVELAFEVGQNQVFTGSGFINSAAISSATNELTTVAFQFTINGALSSVDLTGVV
jgi:hypothetical protein